MWRKEAEHASVQNGRALGNVARGDEQGYGHEVCEGAVPAFSVAAWRCTVATGDSESGET